MLCCAPQQNAPYFVYQQIPVYEVITLRPGIPGGPEGPARPLRPLLGKPGAPGIPLGPEHNKNKMFIKSIEQKQLFPATLTFGSWEPWRALK